MEELIIAIIIQTCKLDDKSIDKEVRIACMEVATNCLVDKKLIVDDCISKSKKGVKMKIYQVCYESYLGLIIIDTFLNEEDAIKLVEYYNIDIKLKMDRLFIRKSEVLESVNLENYEKYRIKEES